MIKKRRIEHAKEDEFSFIAITRATARAYCRALPGWGRVLWAIIVLVYEDYKMQGEISIAQIAELTALSKRRIWDYLQELEAMNMIRCRKRRGSPMTIRLQTKERDWVLQRKSLSYQKQLQKQREKYRKMIIGLIENDLRQTNGGQGN